MDAYETAIRYDIDHGVINGAVVNAGSADTAVIERSWGFASAANGTKMRTDTVIDIASVTKAVATTTAVLICHDDGLVDLDAPFTEYLPEYRAPLRKPITVRDLAMHISGFGQQLHYDAPDGVTIRRNLLTVPPQRLPHDKFEYSCWNFHLLGMLAEHVTGMTLPELCRKRIFDPLGMRDTSLGSPVTADISRLAQTCATDRPGAISDFIAFRLYRDGYTAGNAGVFSTAADLAAFCRCMLRGGVLENGKHLISEKAFDAITVPRMTDGAVRRSFGWIVADEFKPAGASARTIYHSGWSGQTVFIDLDRQCYAVILTTRTVNEYERARVGRCKVIGEICTYLSAISERIKTTRSIVLPR